MSKIDQAKLCLSRRDLSAIAANLQKETGLSRAKALDAIAAAAGYSAGNSLMGSLKDAEKAMPKPCAPGKEAGYLYEVSLRFISDEDLPDSMSLEQIGSEVDHGGSVAGPFHITSIPLAKHDLGRMAEEFGSDPSFFPCFDEDDDEDDE